jgi:hypothetical protein
MLALANALNWAVILGYYKRNPVAVERLASDLIELSTRHYFAYLAGYRNHLQRLGAQHFR